MKKIGLLSDTHGHWDEKYENYFAPCNEIWHAGDIGSMELLEKFESFKPFRGVYGNIDDQKIRSALSPTLRFNVEELDVFMTHIGGYPGKYDRRVKEVLSNNPPKLFVCGHSHILRVLFDKKLNMLYMNPGAAGIYGFHKVRTLLRFTIDKENIKDLEVIELGSRSSK